MKQQKQFEARLIFYFILAVFACFLLVPLGMLLCKSFQGTQGDIFVHYTNIFAQKGFATALSNSFVISGVSALLTTILAFLLAYGIHYTNLPCAFCRFLRVAAVFPMLLPTITYGFAIIYSLGKQGLITQLLGFQPFEIYGFNGLLLGYTIYTFPISFLLIDNAMGYIDGKFAIVSRVMCDSPRRTLWVAVLRPLLSTLATSFVQCFAMCFTDYGIPASIGGEFSVVASVLYNQMLGSIPNFNQGAVVAIVMLVPSALSIALLHYLERYNIRYDRVSQVDNVENPVRDRLFALYSAVLLLGLLSVFVVIFVVPFVDSWPYQMNFRLENFTDVLLDKNLLAVCKNSLLVAGFTALLGTLFAYGAALVTTRSQLSVANKKTIDGIALAVNTVPGMVIGIAYMLLFSGTALQNTFPLIILSNIIHFFSTPYLMMKGALEKMNASWETTAKLMGDSWCKTVVRIITPNAWCTLVEVFSYYFINAMVTVSAVIFIAGTRTMVITAKIKELQHFANFNEIFVLSILLLVFNLLMKGLLRLVTRSAEQEK